MSATRRWHRVGSAWLLLASGAQLAAHLRTYVYLDSTGLTRAQALQALPARWDASEWTAAGFHSFGFGVLLAAFGVAQWVLAREADPRTLRRHALRNALLCVLGALAAAKWHPLPAGLLVLFGAALWFGLAAWPRAFDR